MNTFFSLLFKFVNLCLLWDFKLTHKHEWVYNSCHSRRRCPICHREEYLHIFSALPAFLCWHTTPERRLILCGRCNGRGKIIKDSSFDVIACPFCKGVGMRHETLVPSADYQYQRPLPHMGGDRG